MSGIHALLTTDGLMTLMTLSVLEVVLGIDNLVFIAILVGRLDPERQPLARKVGLTLAMFSRCGLLTIMSTLTSFKRPLFTLAALHFEASGRDLVLLAGGAFLIYKSTREIHEQFEGDQEENLKPASTVSFASIIGQIVLIDIIFSLDSVITAVGIADHLIIMIAAVVLSVGVMLWFSRLISEFINNHPSIKMLALSFLLLIGVMLIAEGSHHHINKGYIYFAMGFALFVEALNLNGQKRKRAAKKKP